MDIKEIRANIAMAVSNSTINGLIADLAQAQYDLAQANAKIAELNKAKLPKAE